MMIVSAACLLTAGGVSGPGVEPSCLGTGSITGAEISDDTVDASLVANSA